MWRCTSPGFRTPTSVSPRLGPSVSESSRNNGDNTLWDGVCCSISANNEQEVEAWVHVVRGWDHVSACMSTWSDCCNKTTSSSLTDADWRTTVLENQLLIFISHWIYLSFFRSHLQIDRMAASRCKEKLLIQFLLIWYPCIIPLNYQDCEINCSRNYFCSVIII